MYNDGQIAKLITDLFLCGFANIRNERFLPDFVFFQPILFYSDKNFKSETIYVITSSVWERVVMN